MRETSLNDSKDIIILDSRSKNTQTKSDLFGNMEFKFISVKDLNYITKLLVDVKDDREFVLKFLFNQLLTPKIEYSDFKKLSEEQLIKISRDFIKSDPDIFKYFKETNDKEFFHNIRISIDKYNEHNLKEFSNLSKSLISSQDLLKDFNEKYANLIIPSFNIDPSTIVRLNEISKIYENFTTQSLDIAQSLKPIIEQNNIYAKVVAEQFSIHTQDLIKWTQDHYNIFSKYNEYWKSFHEKYEIAEKDAIKILKEYNWFISPSMPINFVFEVVTVGKKDGDFTKDINNLFVNYFSKEDYEELDNFVEKWKVNALIKDRIGILNDCILSLKYHNKKYNCSNIIIPTLIAQIDGIRIEFMKNFGLSFWSKDKKWKELFINQVPDFKLEELANDIFLNILFQQSQPGQPLETPFTFSRHKIMHGEELNYGTIDNVIRGFLIIDFLDNLDLKVEK